MAAMPAIVTRATGDAVRTGSTLVRLDRYDAAHDAMGRRAMEFAYESARASARAIDSSDRSHRK